MNEQRALLAANYNTHQSSTQRIWPAEYEEWDYFAVIDGR